MCCPAEGSADNWRSPAPSRAASAPWWRLPRAYLSGGGLHSLTRWTYESSMQDPPQALLAPGLPPGLAKAFWPASHFDFSLCPKLLPPLSHHVCWPLIEISLPKFHLSICLQGTQPWTPIINLEIINSYSYHSVSHIRDRINVHFNIIHGYLKVVKFFKTFFHTAVDFKSELRCIYFNDYYC